MGDVIRFLLDGEVQEVTGANPTTTLLEHLRGPMRRTGTKEGCAEGDCGSCTVLVGELEGEGTAWRAVNACIQFLPMLHGKALITVESLAKDKAPHAVQQAMVEKHGSQCGFCTPGWVGAISALLARAGDLEASLSRLVLGRATPASVSSLCRTLALGAAWSEKCTTELAKPVTTDALKQLVVEGEQRAASATRPKRRECESVRV